MKTANNSAPAYCKAQLIKSGKLNRDAAQAILRADRQYTAEEAAKAVNEFLKREVR